ncbi:hypothetical protein PG988_014836 [Apiospora saccharicola]
MDKMLKCKRDLEETRTLIMRLARITAAQKQTLTKLDTTYKSLKRDLWHLEEKMSDCHESRLAQPILDTIRGRLHNIDNSQNIARQSLRENSAMIKQLWRRVKAMQSSMKAAGGVEMRRED